MQEMESVEVTVKQFLELLDNAMVGGEGQPLWDYRVKFKVFVPILENKLSRPPVIAGHFIRDGSALLRLGDPFMITARCSRCSEESFFTKAFFDHRGTRSGLRAVLIGVVDHAILNHHMIPRGSRPHELFKEVEEKKKIRVIRIGRKEVL